MPGESSRTLPLLASTVDHGTLATLHFLSSLFAFTVAFVILMRFSSLGNHLYLIMGLGLCVVGTEVLLHIGTDRHRMDRHERRSALSRRSCARCR